MVLPSQKESIGGSSSSHTQSPLSHSNSSQLKYIATPFQPYVPSSQYESPIHVSGAQLPLQSGISPTGQVVCE